MSEASLERRLLILAPLGRDAALMRAALRSDGIACEICQDLDALTAELTRGAAALILAEEALAPRDERLASVVAAQPPWSDLPILLLTRQGADSAAVARSLQTLGNVTLLERPVRPSALASAVRSALRARERQYQTRAHLEEREQADRRKDEFLAMLAHELRNPLAPIRNAVHLMRLAGARGADGQIWEMLERQVGHIVRLVDDLLEVSRFTRGKIALRRVPVGLDAVIASAVETSQPLIASARHRLRVNLPAEPLVVDADATRLAQVFSNLLNNAANYTDAGGSIELAARREGGTAVVSVADDGIGIEARALPGVFDLFKQGSERGGRGQAGLGIGLTLARSLVELHGGSIAAASEGPGRGSVFTVRLPLSAALADAPAPADAPASRGGAAPRVLVVDDNRDAADTLGALLRMLGAEVKVVNDGQAAIEVYAAFRPAVMFLDLGMPGLDGYEVARRIRDDAEAAGTALIALTGWGQEKDRQKSKAAGFRHHLVKPIDLTAMQAVLAAVAR
ncbi:MAG TPA: ATP-binding protein [Burkholderiales bacterium]|nr:ATP-binding protein [Burkholderiales bacterium]